MATDQEVKPEEIDSDFDPLTLIVASESDGDDQEKSEHIKRRRNEMLKLMATEDCEYYKQHVWCANNNVLDYSALCSNQDNRRPEDPALDVLTERLLHRNEVLIDGLREARYTLEPIYNFLERLTDGGVVTLTACYDVPCERYEDFVPPERFDDLIATLQWKEISVAYRLCEFEGIYTFLGPVFTTRKEIGRAIVLLDRRAKKPPTEPKLPTQPKAEREPSESDERARTSKERRRELAAWKDVADIQSFIRTLLIPRLERAQVQINTHVSDHSEEYLSVQMESPEKMERYENGGTREKDLVAVELFETAMKMDKEHLNRHTYTADMRKTRTLVMHGLYRDLGEGMQALGTTIAELKKLVSVTTCAETKAASDGEHM
ncbi:uncharacterized protein J4E92_001601 [Alternaria infectoria]|uniref:uncharacterized protein n=1 Tax=Alternaria infectoria TaxID=45303 RepID=UPI00221F9673|nr:uncharacterized protein J4E92_001601 [Alternaria infectoria]KAI4936876.1 hypothetical protein J4E92_001601 [Alternaria infectoria]